MQKKLLLVFVLILIIAMLSVLFIACNKKDDGGSGTTPAVDPGQGSGDGGGSDGGEGDGGGGSGQEPQRTPAEISEVAMANFFTKLYAGNFVINAAKGTTTVYSEDQIYFKYATGYTDPGYAFITINDETFKATYTDSISNVQFVNDGSSALEVAAEITPICWIESLVYNRNIWDIFYNDPENPLKFSAHDENLKSQVLTMNGYVKSAVEFMGDVYVVLDNENPTQVHITADFSGGLPNPDPIDIVITFGNAQASAVINAWMEDPQLPAAKTEWDETDKLIFNSLIYDEDVIPFPTGASYALYYPYSFETMFYFLNAIEIRDHRAQESAVDAYIGLLTAAGFSSHEDNGETTYRKLTSSEYHRYVSVLVEYDNGLNIYINNYYDLDEYSTFNEVRAIVSTKNYPNPVDLPATMAFKSAIDYTPQQIEAMWYLMAYDTYIEVVLTYTDFDAAAEYMNEYIQRLTSAPYNYVYDEEEEYYKSSNDSENMRTGSFRWAYQNEEEIIMLFKSEAYVTPTEVRTYLAANTDFPNPEFGVYSNVLEDHYDSCRDIAKYTKLMSSSEYEHLYAFWLTFDSAADVDAYLNAYVALFDEDKWERSSQPTEYVLYYEAQNMTVTFRVEGNRVCIKFIPAEIGVYYLNIPRVSQEGGIVRYGETGYYKPGKYVYVGASVFEGYTFDGWYIETTGPETLLTTEEEFYYEVTEPYAILRAKWHKNDD